MYVFSAKVKRHAVFSDALDFRIQLYDLLQRNSLRRLLPKKSVLTNASASLRFTYFGFAGRWKNKT